MATASGVVRRGVRAPATHELAVCVAARRGRLIASLTAAPFERVLGRGTRASPLRSKGMFKETSRLVCLLARAARLMCSMKPYSSTYSSTVYSTRLFITGKFL